LDLGEETVLRARAEAQQHRSAPTSPATIDALRAEASQLFEALPEPPAYQRSNDPARQLASELLPKAADLLARLIAASEPAPGDARLSVLVQAVEAHVRALAAIGSGEITRGDNLAREAWEQARKATMSGSFFQLEASQDRAKVYDRATGTSRYDPRPEPALTVQLFCANKECRQPGPFSVSPRYPVHRFTCPACKRPFTGHFAELRGLEAKPQGKAIHYVLRVEPVGGGAASVLEFDDASQGELTAAPRDLIALLYAGTGSLSAVENLTTGQVLWVVPKSACFVATVAFGPDAPELDDFRAFRDEVLLESAAGRAFVRAYYRHGPRLAARLERNRPARCAVRWLLKQAHRGLRKRV
jgi:hypothetical protein